MSTPERHPLSDLHLDAPVSYVGGKFIVTCSCGERFTGQTPDDAGAVQLEHVNALIGDDKLGPFTVSRARMAARRAAQSLRWDGTTTPEITVVQDALSDLLWLAEIIDAEPEQPIEESARFVMEDERTEAGL